MTARIFKHYILISLGIIYFLFYFYYKYQIFELIKDVIYGKVLFSYFSAIIAIFTSYSILSIILRSTRMFIIHLWKRKESKIYPIISGGVLRFMMYANYIISIYIWFALLIIPKEYNHFVNKIVSTIFIIIALLVISSLIITIFENRGVFQFKFANNLSRHLSSIIKKVLLVFVWIIWWITVVSNLWYDVSALITWAWIWWIALALWAQKSLTNVFWAISIVLNKPFRIGDFIRIDSTEWTVKDIWLSYVTLMEIWGHQVMIPNEIIMSRFIQNYSIRENRKWDIDVQLVCSLSQKKLEKAIYLIRWVLQEYEEEKKIEKSTVFFKNFWESSYDIRVRYFSMKFNYHDYLQQRWEINLKIKYALKKEKIDIAIPVRNLIIENK